MERAREALDAEISALEDIVERLRAMGRAGDAEIVETGILMAKDPVLLDRIEQHIMSGQSAPTAISRAADAIAHVLDGLEDATLAERAADIRSLGRRAAARAVGASLGSGGVLIATDLGPADVADLGLAATGAALADGGVTAHAAIVARSLGIPMVVGLGPEVLELKSGEVVVLDADEGVVVRRPTRSRIEAANQDRERRQQARETARARRNEPALTTDGHRVTVLVNAATMAEAVEGFELGAEGIGLLRILVAMVGHSDQLRAIRKVLDEAPGVGQRRPQLGAMIETREAAMSAAAIADVSDFFSIGTNDLTQAALGLDRERSRTAPATDPRVLRLIDVTVRAAHAAGLTVDVCGEAGSDPIVLPVLVGLGVDELSVAAARVGEVRQWVRELDYATCRNAARQLLDEAAHARGERV